MGAMMLNTFNPYLTDPKPCWHCTAFLALTSKGSAALCGRDRAPGTVAMVAAPRRGCAFFEREVGVDDEPDWMPVALSPHETEVFIAQRRRAGDVVAQPLR
jgi:hypothetical protein